MTDLASNSRLCSTCAFWSGTRKLRPGGRVAIHPYSKGHCQGGGFRYAAMAALATCPEWQLWPEAAPTSA